MFSFFAGGSRVIGDYVAADEKDGSSIESHGKENSFGRARIRGTMDKGLKRCFVARASNILTTKSISRETNFIFTISLNDNFKYKSKIYI